MATMPEKITFNVEPKRPHVTAILILSAALLLSLGGNWYQGSLRKNDKILNALNLAQSNTTIAAKESEIAMRQATIDSIRKDRSKDSLQSKTSQTSLKAQIGILRLKIAKLPKEIPYQPDSALVDSLRTAFFLKDSVIDTQQLMIMNLEIEKTGIINSFYKEIRQLEDQKSAQVDISNQLQSQLVSEQANTRKEKRRKGFWKTVSIAAAGGIAFLLLKPD